MTRRDSVGESGGDLPAQELPPVDPSMVDDELTRPASGDAVALIRGHAEQLQREQVVGGAAPFDPTVQSDETAPRTEAARLAAEALLEDATVGGEFTDSDPAVSGMADADHLDQNAIDLSPIARAEPIASPLPTTVAPMGLRRPVQSQAGRLEIWTPDADQAQAHVSLTEGTPVPTARTFWEPADPDVERNPKAQRPDRGARFPGWFWASAGVLGTLVIVAIVLAALASGGAP